MTIEEKERLQQLEKMKLPYNNRMLYSIIGTLIGLLFCYLSESRDSNLFSLGLFILFISVVSLVICLDFLSRASKEEKEILEKIIKR